MAPVLYIEAIFLIQHFPSPLLFDRTLSVVLSCRLNGLVTMSASHAQESRWVRSKTTVGSESDIWKKHINVSKQNPEHIPVSTPLNVVKPTTECPKKWKKKLLFFPNKTFLVDFFGPPQLTPFKATEAVSHVFLGFFLR